MVTPARESNDDEVPPDEIFSYGADGKVRLAWSRAERWTHTPGPDCLVKRIPSSLCQLVAARGLGSTCVRQSATHCPCVLSALRRL